MEAPNTSESTLSAALSYANQGMPVFPCKPNKSPATPNGFYDSTTDENQVHAWWENRPDALIGLRTGKPSGHFVLDVDNGEVGRASLSQLAAEHGPLPETYTVSTPGNPSKGKDPGEQLYFRYPEGVDKVKSSVSELATNLDVRGDGGYVIAPPSPGYGVLRGSLDDVAEASGWLVELVRDDRPAQVKDMDEDVPEGMRNAALTSLAGSMRLRGASTTTILVALNEENQVKCKPPLPWPEVAAIARSVGRYAPGSLARTDTGNAERLVGRHGHDLKHVYGLGWYVWEGTHWQRDETGAVERRAKDTVRSIHEEAARVADDGERKELAKWAMASESASRLRAMISLAKSEPGIPLRVENLDADPWFLNCENGTVDLRTGELKEHNREDLITKVAPVEYDPQAEAPSWEAFLARVLPDESVREFVRRAVGYSLTGVVKEKVLPFLYGPKDTGKTTFVETIMGLLGDGYAQPAAPDLLLAKGGNNHPTELADLLGKRFVATVEVQQGRRLAESLVKQLTGGDRIKARFMREDFFTFRPTHKIWFAANHRPVVRGTDDAIWGRIKLVPFEVQIPESEQDKGLPEKLQAEAGGILAWAVQGCLDWQRRGNLGEPEGVQAATKEYQEEMDPLADFFDEQWRFDPETWTSNKDLQQSYKGWCEQAGQKQLDWNMIADRLKELGCVRWRRRGRRGWLGVGLREVKFQGEDEEEGANTGPVPPVPPGAPQRGMDEDRGEEDPVHGTGGAPVGHQGTQQPHATLVAPEDAPALVEQIGAAEVVALDLETTGLDPRRDEIRLLSLATPGGIWLIDCSTLDPGPILAALAGKKLIAHNSMFDLLFLRRLGYKHRGRVTDTMILSRMVHAGEREASGKRLDHSLEACCRRELGLDLDKTHQKADWSGELSEEMLRYAAEDARVLWLLYDALARRIRKQGQERAVEIEERVLPAVIEMAHAGVSVDKDRWLRMIDEAKAELEDLRAPLDALAGAPPEEVRKRNANNKNIPAERKDKWNWDSTEQVKAAAKSVGLKLQKTSMDHLKRANHDLASALLAYKEVRGNLGTYSEKFVEPTKEGREVYTEGRIYPSWKVCEADTGRMSCAEPNMQNIPSKSRLRELRTCVVAPEGRVLVVADYSQIELRVAAKVAGEEAMLEAYREGKDLHGMTARSITGREEVSEGERKLAKAVNFGLLYGQGAESLQSYARNSYGVEMSLGQAERYRQRFFEAYPSVRTWHRKEGKSFDAGDKTARSLRGRRRRVGRFTEKINAPVQGTAADGMKVALALLWERRVECPGAVPVLAVHDEIVVECDEEDADKAEAWLKKAMVDGMDAVVNATGPHVPIEVETSVSQAWGE